MFEDKGNTLTFLFKSGAQVSFDRVTNWKVQTDGDFIVGLTVYQNESRKRRFIAKSIDLKSIDLIWDE